MAKLIGILFISFTKIGLLSIGGGYAVIPMIQAEVVNGYKWLTAREFTDIITISQMTPGPLAVNTSTFVGMRIAGVGGAVAATVGCISGGIIISALLYLVFQKQGESKTAADILLGLHSTSLGLIISAAATILLLAIFGVTEYRLDMADVNFVALGLFLTLLFVLRRFQINPIHIILVSGLAGLFFYY